MRTYLLGRRDIRDIRPERILGIAVTIVILRWHLHEHVVRVQSRRIHGGRPLDELCFRDAREVLGERDDGLVIAIDEDGKIGEERQDGREEGLELISKPEFLFFLFFGPFVVLGLLAFREFLEAGDMLAMFRLPRAVRYIVVAAQRVVLDSEDGETSEGYGLVEELFERLGANCSEWCEGRHHLVVLVDSCDVVLLRPGEPLIEPFWWLWKASISAYLRILLQRR